MNLRGSLAFALLTGVAGVFVGRYVPAREPSPKPPRTGAVMVESIYAPSTAQATPCKADRAELASTKAELAICMAYGAPPSPPERDSLTDSELEEAERVRRDIEVLQAHTEVVIVRRADHTTSIYPVGEPIPDGIIVARRFRNGEVGWYVGSGSRDDPASFRPAPPGSPLEPVIERGQDGKLYVNGKLGAPGLQHMFPGTKKKAH
jgi:hypothetical protein